MTAAMLAAYRGSLSCLRILAELGADLGARDIQGRHALMQVAFARQCHLDCAEFLAHAGLRVTDVDAHGNDSLSLAKQQERVLLIPLLEALALRQTLGQEALAGPALGAARL